MTAGSNGWNQSADTSDGLFVVSTKAPTITITNPSESQILVVTEPMQGRCVARDPETGGITDPNAIVWSSSIDGVLGKGSLLGFELSLGSHVLTATATDPEGKTATATVHVQVVVPFYKVDFNGDRKVNALDLASLAGLWFSPDANGTPYDLDKDGAVDIRDFIVFAQDWRAVYQGVLPVAHWTFDEGDGTVAHDSAGMNHATVTGASWTEGKVGGALQFDGVDDCVDCNESLLFSPETLSVACWVCAGAGGPPTSYVAYKGRGSLFPDKDYAIARAIAGPVGFSFGNDPSNSVTMWSQSNVGPGEWTHLAVTRDGARCAIYLNGNLDATANYTFVPDNKNQDLTIGAMGPGQSHFLGMIDDFRIYDRALSPKKIKNLFDETSGHAQSSMGEVHLDIPGSMANGEAVPLTEPVTADVYYVSADLTVFDPTATVGIYLTGSDGKNKLWFGRIHGSPGSTLGVSSGPASTGAKVSPSVTLPFSRRMTAEIDRVGKRVKLWLGNPAEITYDNPDYEGPVPPGRGVMPYYDEIGAISCLVGDTNGQVSNMLITDSFDDHRTRQVSPSPLAGTTLLTFEGITGGEAAQITTGYGGLSWSSAFWVVNATRVTNSGYGRSIISPSYMAYNQSGQDVQISGSAFDLVGAYMAGAWRDNLNIEIQGYRSTARVYTKTAVVSSTKPTWVQLDFQNVDRVTFRSYGGTPNPAYDLSGTQMAMDNMVIRRN